MGMYGFLLHRILRRIIVAVMLGAFVPAVIAAAACETTCVSDPAGASDQATGRHEHADAVHADHQDHADAADTHMAHDGICSLSGMVCIAPANCLPILGKHVGSWSHPVEDRFDSAIWPPPVQPPKT